MLAAGASNGMGLSINAEQAYVTFSASGQLISKGDVASIKSAGGSDLFSAAASCDASFVFFSSPELDSGSSYSLYAGDSSAASIDCADRHSFRRRQYGRRHAARRSSRWRQRQIRRRSPDRHSAGKTEAGIRHPAMII